MEVAKITSKGQITIPISIRRKLELSEGDKVLFIYKPDGILMVNPTKYHGGTSSDVVEVAESEMAAEAVAAMKERSTGKSAPPPQPVAEPPPAAAIKPEPAIKEAAEEAAIINEYAAEPAPRPAPPPLDDPEKPAPSVGGLNLGSLLDDIRSIGSNI